MTSMEEIRSVARDCTEIFSALGDPHRQDILILLETEGPLNVLQITENSELSRPTISHHLKVLKDAGLVTVEKRSRENFYTTEWGDSSGKLINFMNKVLKH
jgi:ArsR family transcriptional regulator